MQVRVWLSGQEMKLGTREQRGVLETPEKREEVVAAATELEC